MEVTIATEQKVDVQYLLAECGVRYWDDAAVNEVVDDDGDLIPCREGDYWKPLIHLRSGRITNWREGTRANIHYKVCDDGSYKLLTAGLSVVGQWDNIYVPSILSPKNNGWGDYVIMDVDEQGYIRDFKPNLDCLLKRD